MEALTNLQKLQRAYDACNTSIFQGTVMWEKDGQKFTKDYTTSENEIFLGGTCAGSTQREPVKAILKQMNFCYFDPQVKDWQKGDSDIEIYKKATSKIHFWGFAKEQKGLLTPYEVGISLQQTLTHDKELFVLYLVGTQEEWENHGVVHNYKAIKSMMADIEQQIANYAITHHIDETAIRNRFIIAHGYDEIFRN